MMQQEHKFPILASSAKDEESLGARLRRLRISRGIRQGEFAVMLGVSKQTVWKWEYHDVRPRARTLRAAAAILGVNRDELTCSALAPESRQAHGDEQALAVDLPLGDVISLCKARIAKAAGTSSEAVSITINV